MKKLMIVAAVAVSAVMAQAADFQWKVSGYIYDGFNNNGEGYSKKALGSQPSIWLINGVDHDSAAIMSAIADGTDMSSWAIATQPSGTDGKPTSTAYNDVSNWGSTFYDKGQDLTFAKAYVVIKDGNNVFVSGELSSQVIEMAGQYTQVSLSLSSPTQVNMTSKTEYAGAGWYAAVPEPTSGLLLLLGVAGLALRRRRA